VKYFYGNLIVDTGISDGCNINKIVFFSWRDSPRGLRRPRYWAFTITLRHYTLGLLWPSDQRIAETSSWQNTTLTRAIYPCLPRDSNPYSQQTYCG